MAVDTTEQTTSPALRQASWPTAALLVSGGLLMAVGGKLHPTGSGDTVDAHLLSMFQSSRWLPAHVVLLAGGIVSALAFLSAWRTEAFGPKVQRWLPVVAGGWAFGALELVPHLLAADEASSLAHHEPTPVLDVHVVLQVIASPAVGVTGAFVAIAVARAAGTRPARALAVLGVVGGLLSAAAGPLVVLTGDPRFTVLFPFQAGLAVWLLGTGIRLLSRGRVPRSAPASPRVASDRSARPRPNAFPVVPERVSRP